MAPTFTQLLILYCLVNVNTMMSQLLMNSQEPITVHEWIQIDYDWDNSTKQEYIANGGYIKEHIVITGVKLYQDRIFVTVPRWKRGVPSTLNEVIINNITNKPVLRAYPSWKDNTIDDCNYLQNTQSMEITPNGKMWIIDVGNKYLFETYNHLCPPKIWIYNINENKLENSYTFPNAVTPYDTSFLNDIVVDNINNIAYISDSDVGGDGAIIVYDYNNNLSHRYSDVSMRDDGDNSAAQTVTINGYSIPATSSPINGIALSPDRKYIYYAPLSSYRLYRVPSFNVRYYEDDSLGEIEFMGNRTSQMDGMTFSNESVLYFGSLGENAVYQMKYKYKINEKKRSNYVAKHCELLIANDVTMQWPDSFGWGNDGYLYFTSNRIQRYLLNNYDWSGNEGANFRIIKVYVGASSYMSYTQIQSKDSDDDDDSVEDAFLSLSNRFVTRSNVWLTLDKLLGVLCVIAVLLGVCVLLLTANLFKQKQKRYVYDRVNDVEK